MSLQPARQAKNRKQMHTEENRLTEMRRLGFVLTPLAHVGYHFEYCGHDLFLCPGRKQNNVMKIVRPLSTDIDLKDNTLISNLVNETNNVMTMTTASIVDEDTIWVSYSYFLFGNEPLGELLKMAISAVTSTAEYLLKGLKRIL